LNKTPKRKYKTARCILYRDDVYLLADHGGTKSRRGRRGEQETHTKWGLPGGHVEWRESAAETAAREVYEELNIHLSDLQSVGDYVYKQRWHAVFAAPSPATTFELDFSELREVRWFTRDQILQLKHFNNLHAGYELEAVFRLEQIRNG